MGGYDSGYYGYLWSEVFCYDVFQHFQSHGLMNAQVGKHYRDKILSQGKMKDAEDLLIDFLGRPASNKAFLLELGIEL